jgi:uncharacterized membrane protein YbhN (UPF0104 family)
MFWKVLTVSLVVMGLSHTISRERLFAPLRRAMGGRETWLGYLISCPYCVSHWMAFLLVPLTGTYAIEVVPHWGPLSAVLRWLLSSVLVTAVAAFLRVAFYFVDETQGLVRRQQRAVDEQKNAAGTERTRLSDGAESDRPDDQAPDARH